MDSCDQKSLRSSLRLRSLCESSVSSSVLWNDNLDDSPVAELPHNTLVRLYEASRLVCSEIDYKHTVGYILAETLKLLNCASTALYIHTQQSLTRITVSNDLPFTLIKTLPDDTTATLVNQVITQGKTVRMDIQTGQIMLPVQDPFGNVLAVLEVVGKLSVDDTEVFEFSDDDESMLVHFSMLAGVALRNSALYKEAVASRDLANGLLTLLSSLGPDLTIQSAIVALTSHSKQLMQAEHCTFYMIDRVANNLLSVSSDSVEKVTMRHYFNEELDDSELGECARNGQPVIRQYDCDTGQDASSIAVVPIRAGNDMTIGLIKITNKRDEDGVLLEFSDSDVRLLELFGRLIGPRLEVSGLGLKATTLPPTEAGRAISGAVVSRRRTSIAAPPIREEEDDECCAEDDDTYSVSLRRRLYAHSVSSSK